METNQRPEEILSKHTGETGIYLTRGLVRGSDALEAMKEHSQSLSTEIERLRQHNVAMMSDNIKLIDNFNALKLKLSGNTSSCPVCDSMAERNKELEEGLRDLKENKFSNNNFIARAQKIEQLLSKQNNGTRI